MLPVDPRQRMGESARVVRPWPAFDRHPAGPLGRKPRMPEMPKNRSLMAQNLHVENWLGCNLDSQAGSTLKLGPSHYPNAAAILKAASAYRRTGASWGRSGSE
jgi:hypothetical protein